MEIQIVLNKDIEKARTIVYGHLSDKKVRIEEVDHNSRYLFNIIPVKSKMPKELYDDIAKLILDLILNLYSVDVIHKRIRNSFNNIGPNEKVRIINISEKLLLDKNNFCIEKEFINEQIKKYLMTKSFISIDGFLSFRLKGFNPFIDMVIDRGIKEFAVEKEYWEFIRTLRYFVHAQEPKYDVIDIIFEEKDYKIFDKYNKQIKNVIFEEIITELNYININEEDLLISSLIVLCPQRIVIHLDEKDKSKDVIKIITDVFQDKVYFCTGCEKCIKKSGLNKELIRLNN